MTDEFGPWEPWTVEQVATLFAGAPFRWWLTGGIALELFACRSWRQHEDLDVGICRGDAPRIHDWLRDFELFVAACGRLRTWSGEPLSDQQSENNVWVKRTASGPFVFDIAIGAGDAGEWVYRRDPRIRRPWEETLLRTADGVPYLAPEIQLLFKSKGLRAKDTRDADVVIPLLESDRRAWLRSHLPAEHPWQALIDGRKAAHAPCPAHVEDRAVGWMMYCGTDRVWVRPVDLATDIPELTELLHRAYRELADLGYRYVASFQDEATTQRRAGRGTCFVALLGSRIVGTITLYDIAQTTGCAWYDREDVSHFGQFAVDPAFRSRGLGSALLDLVERRAAEMGACELALNTADGADYLIRYYGRRGYREVERVDWGINYNSVILSKTLRENRT
jgi:GNAT superfamily N-acetyltransferase